MAKTKAAATGKYGPLLEPAVLAALGAFRTPTEADPAREVAAIFLELTPQRLAQLADAMARADEQAVYAIAHLLAGSAAAVGARAMHSAAIDLELDSARRAGDAHVLVDALAALFAQTRPLLEEYIHTDADAAANQS